MKCCTTEQVSIYYTTFFLRNLHLQIQKKKSLDAVMYFIIMNTSALDITFDKSDEIHHDDKPLLKINRYI